jgi:hypothetical protein
MGIVSHHGEISSGFRWALVMLLLVTEDGIRRNVESGGSVKLFQSTYFVVIPQLQMWDAEPRSGSTPPSYVCTSYCTVHTYLHTYIQYPRWCSACHAT